MWAPNILGTKSVDSLNRQTVFIPTKSDREVGPQPRIYRGSLPLIRPVKKTFPPPKRPLQTHDKIGKHPLRSRYTYMHRCAVPIPNGGNGYTCYG